MRGRFRLYLQAPFSYVEWLGVWNALLAGPTISWQLVIYCYTAYQWIPFQLDSLLSCFVLSDAFVGISRLIIHFYSYPLSTSMYPLARSHSCRAVCCVDHECRLSSWVRVGALVRMVSECTDRNCVLLERLYETRAASCRWATEYAIDRWCPGGASSSLQKGLSPRPMSFLIAWLSSWTLFS